MGLPGFIGAVALTVGLYCWLALPRLRRHSWWNEFVVTAWARAGAIAGNSRTVAVGYAAELLGLLDEVKVLDWSQAIGAERAGRVMVAMGVAMIVLRLITRTPVRFKAP